MPMKIEFGSRKEANQMRDRIEEYLASSDSRRSKTIKLSPQTPDHIVERVQDEAFASARNTRDSAGMEELTEQEKQSLKRQHRTFDWQQHGFEAMRVKAALERKGVTDWMDYYEPGEGVQSALNKLQQAKQRAAQGGGRTAVGGDYTDEEEVSGQRRRQRQTERMQSGQVESAKRPAFGGDEEAIGFLQEEQRFDDDLFDISFGTDRFGRPTATGTDVDELKDANQERSKQARRMDDLSQAPVTRSPLEWAANKDEFDFPSVDMLDPSKKHATRSERARETDENELAPIADSVPAWANNMDEMDLPGIDTPDSDDDSALPGF